MHIDFNHKVEPFKTERMKNSSRYIKFAISVTRWNLIASLDENDVIETYILKPFLLTQLYKVENDNVQC